MAGKFVIRKSGEQYDFVLKSGNGETVATSERYTTKQGAEDGVEAVKQAAADAETEDATGE